MLYLRIIYITFYSLKNDFEALNIVQDDIFDSRHNSTFRNSMAHYSLYDKITETEIMPNVLGYGLIEKYFGCDYSSFVGIIETKLLSLKILLENQFSLGIKQGYDPDRLSSK